MKTQKLTFDQLCKTGEVLSSAELSSLKGGNSELYDSAQGLNSLYTSSDALYNVDLTGIAPPSIPSLTTNETDYSSSLGQNQIGMIWDKTPVLINQQDLLQEALKNNLIMV
jgi:natural product precursor